VQEGLGGRSEFVVIKAENRRTAGVRKRPAAVDPEDVLVFLIPCLQFLRINLIGVLDGSDLILLIVFLYLAFRRRLRIATPVGKWTLALCALWLASQCVTDIVRHSTFADFARGWSNIGLTFVNLAALWTLLYGRPRRLVIFGWGLATGGVLLFLASPHEELESPTLAFAWKFFFAYSMSLGVFLLAGRKECRGHWPITLAVMMGIINIALGSRAYGGICMAAAFLLFVVRVARRKNPGISRLKAGTAVALAASILLSVTGVMWAYGRAASAGVLGQDAKDKYEQESSGKYGVLLGGRTELLASLPAVYDSPILGHGSWAKDPIYIIQQHQALFLLGYQDAARLITPQDLRYGLIPAHSYFFQAWVDAGILGAVFWGWVLVMTARVLLRIYPETARLLPAAAFLVFLLLWSIPFSPYGTDGRLTFPYTFVMLMTLMDTPFRTTVRVTTTPAGRIPRTKPKRIA